MLQLATRGRVGSDVKNNDVIKINLASEEKNRERYLNPSPGRLCGSFGESALIIPPQSCDF